jgi:hypothetical protein
MKINKILIFITLSTFYSCSTSSPSGPCEYVEEKFNMRVLDVIEDPNDTNLYIVPVDFDGNISYASGTHTFSEVRNVVTDYDFIVRNEIRPGSIYTGTAHIKVEGTGNCEKEIIDWNQKLKK